MPQAATYWLAHMDRYLILKDAEDLTDELDLISESIDDLIEIFYRALDAGKTGEEVCFPHRHMFAWMSVCILPPLSVMFWDIFIVVQLGFLENYVTTRKQYGSNKVVAKVVNSIVRLKNRDESLSDILEL